MAERRPLTARDVKSNVEGYSEMSDEAFARRFYSDRAELLGLGVPLQSQRDEFTGEELYTLRSENYFLPQLDLADDDAGGQIKTFRVSRIRGDIRFATRRERDFRMPEFDIEAYVGRPPWQIGDLAGEARIAVAHDTAWWVERVFGDAGYLDADIFVTEYASLEQLASWILRQDGRAVPQEPDELRRVVKEGLQRVREGHEADKPQLAREAARSVSDGVGER